MKLDDNFYQSCLGCEQLQRLVIVSKNSRFEPKPLENFLTKVNILLALFSFIFFLVFFKSIADHSLKTWNISKFVNCQGHVILPSIYSEWCCLFYFSTSIIYPVLKKKMECFPSSFNSLCNCWDSMTQNFKEQVLMIKQIKNVLHWHLINHMKRYVYMFSSLFIIMNIVYKSQCIENVTDTLLKTCAIRNRFHGNTCLMK
jgi:hypothetical protein